MTDGDGITLEQLLKARDQRAEKQKQLISIFNLPVLSFTVNMPGKYKKTSTSSRIFREGCRALIKSLEKKGKNPLYFAMDEPETGPEAYVVVNLDQYALKELALEMENRHPLGRLMDLDVIGPDGNAVSREELGYPKRACLLCGRDAHLCARSRAHPLELLLKKIQGMADTYFAERVME